MNIQTSHKLRIYLYLSFSSPKPTQAVVIVVVANLTENLVYYDSLKAYRSLVYI